MPRPDTTDSVYSRSRCMRPEFYPCQIHPIRGRLGRWTVWTTSPCRTDQGRNSDIPLRTTPPDAQQGQDPHYQCEKRASQILRNPDLNWKRYGTEGGVHDEWLKKAGEAAIDGLGNRPGSPSG